MQSPRKQSRSSLSIPYTVSSGKRNREASLLDEDVGDADVAVPPIGGTLGDVKGATKTLGQVQTRKRGRMATGGCPANAMTEPNDIADGENDDENKESDKDSKDEDWVLEMAQLPSP